MSQLAIWWLEKRPDYWRTEYSNSQILDYWLYPYYASSKSCLKAFFSIRKLYHHQAESLMLQELFDHIFEAEMSHSGWVASISRLSSARYCHNWDCCHHGLLQRGATQGQFHYIKFHKKDSKRCCDTTTPESIHTKDESKCGFAFAFIFGVNWPLQWM